MLKKGIDRFNDYKDNNFGSYIFGVILLIAIVLLLLLVITAKFFVLPMISGAIHFAVPTFWSYIGYIFIIWFIYKFFCIVFYPIYSLIGKWFFLLIGMTIIYIGMVIM